MVYKLNPTSIDQYQSKLIPDKPPTLDQDGKINENHLQKTPQMHKLKTHCYTNTFCPLRVLLVFILLRPSSPFFSHSFLKGWSVPFFSKGVLVFSVLCHIVDTSDRIQQSRCVSVAPVKVAG